MGTKFNLFEFRLIVMNAPDVNFLLDIFQLINVVLRLKRPELRILFVVFVWLHHHLSVSSATIATKIYELMW